MAEPSFTREYFHAEVLRLHEAWGTVTFWEDPEAAQKAVKAVGYVYLRTPGATDSDQRLFQFTLEELTRREVLVALRFRREVSHVG